MAREQTGIQPWSRQDTFNWTLAALLALLGVGGFYYFEEQALLYRVLGVVAVFSLAAALALLSPRGRYLAGFVGDARGEVRKMVWPTRVETLQTALVVFVAVLLMATFMWLLDRLLTWAVRLLLG